MGDDLKKELETISNTLRDLGAKFDDLAVKVDRLAPLTPVATKLAALPEKVVTNVLMASPKRQGAPLFWPA